MNDENRAEENGTALEVVQNIEPSALMAITKGEVDMQVSTAKTYPRSIKRSIEEMETLACIDQPTAESCFYAYRRGGKLIEGPSIRMAEIVAMSYGNLRCEARVVETGRKDTTAQATTWDMEKNVLVRIEAKRRITDRNGNRYGDDMIMTTQNAAISIALRNSVFRVVPRAYVNKVLDRARKVAFGDAASMEQRKAKMITTFAKLGVSEEQILLAVDKGAVEDMDAGDLSKLIGAFNKIKNGETLVDEMFPPLPEGGPEMNGSRVATLKDKLNKRKEAQTEEDEERAAIQGESPAADNGQLDIEKQSKDNKKKK